jgi:bifunctional non-homologous end joining protein LigD
VVVIHEGRTNFSELQAELAAGGQSRLVYYAFDLLWRDGEELRRIPQLERKCALQRLFQANDLEAPAFYSEDLVGDGQKMFEHATGLNFEGIIPKKADASYKSERGEAGEDQGGPAGEVSCHRVQRIHQVLQHSTLANERAKSCATWAR